MKILFTGAMREMWRKPKKRSTSLLSEARITTHHTGNTQLWNYCLCLPFLQKVLVADESRKVDLGEILILYPPRLLTLWINSYPYSLASPVTGITNSSVLVIDKEVNKTTRCMPRIPPRLPLSSIVLVISIKEFRGAREHSVKGRTSSEETHRTWWRRGSSEETQGT